MKGRPRTWREQWDGGIVYSKPTFGSAETNNGVMYRISDEVYGVRRERCNQNNFEYIAKKTFIRSRFLKAAWRSDVAFDGDEK